MSTYDFDTAYSAVTGEQHLGESIPTVEIDNDAVHGVLLDGAPRTTAIEYPGKWYALTGYSQQHGYRGAVMHPSETMSDEAVREAVREAGGDLFALVEVRDEDGSYPDGDAIGWAIVYKAAA